ncbi:MAG: TonB-dependent receptor domain-containing protein [Maricaulaceae bacterium]
MKSLSWRERLLATTVIAGFSAVAFSPAAIAQQAAPEGDPDVEEVADGEDAEDVAQVEQIVVTGSRIRRAPLDSALATTSIEREQFDLRGFTNAIDAINELPLTGAGGGIGGGGGSGSNASFVDLLNFGTQRTLTLIDGKRFVSGNLGSVFVLNDSLDDANNTGSQVDLNIINPLLIENQEVLTVGGGPIYGADAVAGVVNVVLNDEFEGFEVLAQGGITQRGDGENYRVTAAYGTDVLNGKGHFTLGAEWVDSEIVVAGNGRPASDGFGGFLNPFSDGGADEIPDSVFFPGSSNNFITSGGTPVFGQFITGGTGDFFFPQFPSGVVPNGGDGIANFNNFIASTGSTPLEFALANPDLNGIDPLAFVGSFGLENNFFTVPNTDPNSSGFLPLTAVPLQFAPDGTLVPIDLGSIIPGVGLNIEGGGPVALPPSDQDDKIGGDGFAALGEFNSIQSAQERVSVNAFFNYDFTPNVRYKGSFIFANQTFNALPGVPTQPIVGGAGTAGVAPVPVFIDENPFLTQQAIDTINDLEATRVAAGLPGLDTIDGSRTFFVSRNLTDIITPSDTEDERSRTFAVTQSLEGDFEFADRAFYWETAFRWSRASTTNLGDPDILDIEFALATDVVADPITGEAVCRQQTLAAPEAVDIRNPALSGIDISTAEGLVPTQAQIDACVPLNLFGAGAPSAEAIDFVTGPLTSFNRATQFFTSATLGGELLKLPAGWFQFASNFEWRRDSVTFVPGDQFFLGTGRATSGTGTFGALGFFEGGTELSLPVFSDDFNPIPGFKRLDLDGVVRVVSRVGSGFDAGSGLMFGPFFEGETPIAEAPRLTDITFSGGGRWSPIDAVTFRGNFTRAVRSPSVVDLFGAAATGFVGNASPAFACNGFNQPDGTPLRIPSCEAFADIINAQSLPGVPFVDLGFFASLLPGGAGGLPAAVLPNPALLNETSNNWTVGVVLEADRWIDSPWVDRLTLSADWVSLTLDDVIDGTFLTTDLCFDAPGFPDTVVGASSVCDNLVLALPDPDDTSTFIVPEINPITGNPVPDIANPGAPAINQELFTLAFLLGDANNVGGQRLRALNFTADYVLDLDRALANRAILPNVSLGQLFINGQVYFLERFDTTPVSGDFDPAIVNPNAGEPGFARFETRLQATHRIDRFTQTIQWFHFRPTIDNLQDTTLLDNNATFTNPALNIFNYNLGYQVNDRLTTRFIVNNLLDRFAEPGIGVDGGQIGRNFVLSANYRF